MLSGPDFQKAQIYQVLSQILYAEASVVQEQTKVEYVTYHNSIARQLQYWSRAAGYNHWWCETIDQELVCTRPLEKLSVQSIHSTRHEHPGHCSVYPSSGNDGSFASAV